jgi:hypothetical protein
MLRSTGQRLHEVFSALATALMVVVASSTTFAACPDTVGDSAIIKVPPGLNVRIMYYRRKADPSYVEICESREKDTQLLFEAKTDLRTWHAALSISAKTERSYLKTYSDRVSDTTHESWAGMRWVPTDFGIIQNWYGKADSGYDPNTMIEVCLYQDINECPIH